MSLILQYLETVAFSNKLSVNFACSTSEDGRISLLTENGILIYTLMNYMDNIFNEMAFRKKFIKSPEYSLSAELGIDFETLYDKIPKHELFEKVLRLDLTSQLNHSTPVETKPIAVAWSPKGLLGKSFCVLAILTNFHGLSLYLRHIDEATVERYVCVANVTKHIVEEEAKIWSNIERISPRLQILEWNKRANSTCPTAVVWSHCITTLEETFALLFVGHSNGSITTWKFVQRREHEHGPSLLKFSGKFQSSLVYITCMHWAKTSKNGGALSYGDANGKLAVVSVSDLNKDSIIFKDEVIFLNESDEMKVSYLMTIEHSDFTYLIAVRGNFLVFFAIDHGGIVLDQLLFDMGIQITGICHYKDNVLLVLTLGRLKKMTLNVKNSTIEVVDEIVPLKLDNTKFKTHGMLLSENKLFVGILVFPCRLKDITRDPTPSNLLFYHDTSVSPFQVILKNTHSLEKYWDCFEILRLISFKEKRFPWQGIEKHLNYDKLTLTQLKSLRWISKLSQNVYNVITHINEYNIKAYILLHYMVTVKLVIERMRKLINILNSGKELTIFQMRSLDIQNMFLKEMVMMKIPEKSNMGERFLDELVEVMEIANELEYPDMPPCFWCGEKITGPTCIPPHADSRCAISMMQIFVIPGFKCLHCKCVAHPKIIEEMDVVTCPFCDIPMDQIYSTERVEALLNNKIEIKDKLEFILKDDTPEYCFVTHPEDIIIGDVPLEEIEDSQINYVTLTDSEDDEEIFNEERRNFLQNKFFETLKATKPSSSQQDLGEFSGNNEMINEISTRENGNSDYSFDEDSDNGDVKSVKKPVDE